MSTTLITAQRAFDTIPFYRDLYGDRPGRAEEVPFTSPTTFHRPSGPRDVIASASKIMGAVPSFRRGTSRLPLTVLESEEEWRTRVERLRGALNRLGCPVDAGMRFSVVLDDLTGPFASDVSNTLAWDRVECSILFSFRSPRTLVSTLSAISPDVVIVTSPNLAPDEIQAAGRKLIAIQYTGAVSPRLVPFDRLLVSDELWVIGAARAGEEVYRFDGGSLLFEIEPWSGQLAVTTPAFTLFAFVRYCLGSGLTLLGSDQLRYA